MKKISEGSTKIEQVISPWKQQGLQLLVPGESDGIDVLFFAHTRVHWKPPWASRTFLFECTMGSSQIEPSIGIRHGQTVQLRVSSLFLHVVYTILIQNSFMSCKKRHRHRSFSGPPRGAWARSRCAAVSSRPEGSAQGLKMGTNLVHNFGTITIRWPTKSSEKNVVRGFERVRVTGADPSQMVKNSTHHIAIDKVLRHQWICVVRQS